MAVMPRVWRARLARAGGVAGDASTSAWVLPPAQASVGAEQPGISLDMKNFSFQRLAEK